MNVAEKSGSLCICLVDEIAYSLFMSGVWSSCCLFEAEKQVDYEENDKFVTNNM